MPVEVAGVRQAGHTGRQRKLAQRQFRVAPPAALEPRLHLRPGGDTNQRIVERCRVAFEDGAFAAADRIWTCVRFSGTPPARAGSVSSVLS